MTGLEMLMITVCGIGLVCGILLAWALATVAADLDRYSED